MEIIILLSNPNSTHIYADISDIIPLKINCIPLAFLLTAVSDIQLFLLCKVLAEEAHDESSHGTNCNWHRTDDAPQIHSMLNRHPKEV